MEKSCSRLTALAVRIESRLVQLGWITPTKNLIRQMRGRGVKIERWGAESNYSPFFRQIQIPTARRGGSNSGKPVMDLWHEAGHDLTRNTGILARPGTTKVGGALQGHGERRQFSPIALKVNPVLAANTERQANRAADKAIGKLSGTFDDRFRYARAVQPHYDDYRAAAGPCKRSVPKSAFALAARI
jgi:hypothetical protein